MAAVMKHRNVWYVRYKDESGHWRKISCGRNSKKIDATFIASQYTAKEMNNRYKATVRILKTPLLEALLHFQQNILPIPKTDSGRKELSSIRREQTIINNFMEERRVLNCFFKWAIKSHNHSENPMEEIVAPKPQKTNPRYFSLEELDLIFKAASEPYLSIFKFLFYTGLRTGELANLEWRDYNAELENITIRIIAQDRKNRVPGNKVKREESVLPLSKKALEIITIRQHESGDSPFIFSNHYGNRIDNDNIYRNLKRILNQCNIQDAHPHTFRHSFASHLVIKGVSIYTVKELMRHASVKDTEIYAHLSQDVKRSAVQLL